MGARMTQAELTALAWEVEVYKCMDCGRDVYPDEVEESDAGGQPVCPECGGTLDLQWRKRR